MTVTITAPNGWAEESFYVRTEDRWDWMDVTIRSKGSMIHVKFNSSYVAGAFNWNYCGDDADWREWLLDTDFDYFMGKMFGLGSRVFSMRKTVECILSVLKEHSEEWGLDPVLAEGLKREVLEKAEEIESETGIVDIQCHMLMEWLWVHPHELLCDDPGGYIQQEYRNDLVQFWSKLWRPFIEGVQV